MGFIYLFLQWKGQSFPESYCLLQSFVVQFPSSFNYDTSWTDATASWQLVPILTDANNNLAHQAVEPELGLRPCSYSTTCYCQQRHQPHIASYTLNYKKKINTRNRTTHSRRIIVSQEMYVANILFSSLVIGSLLSAWSIPQGLLQTSSDLIPGLYIHHTHFLTIDNIYTLALTIYYIVGTPMAQSQKKYTKYDTKAFVKQYENINTLLCNTISRYSTLHTNRPEEECS